MFARIPNFKNFRPFLTKFPRLDNNKTRGLGHVKNSENTIISYHKESACKCNHIPDYNAKK